MRLVYEYYVEVGKIEINYNNIILLKIKIIYIRIDTYSSVAYDLRDHRLYDAHNNVPIVIIEMYEYSSIP